MTVEYEEPRSYEQHLDDIKQLVASGAGRWALEDDKNDGRRIKPSDLVFRDAFLDKHVEATKQ